MRLVFLLGLVGTSALALPGEQVSKLTLGVDATPAPARPRAANTESAAVQALAALEFRMLERERMSLVGPLFLLTTSALGFTVTGVLALVFPAGGALAFVVMGLIGGGGLLLVGMPWLVVALLRNEAIDAAQAQLVAQEPRATPAGVLVASF